MRPVMNANGRCQGREHTRERRTGRVDMTGLAGGTVSSRPASRAQVRRFAVLAAACIAAGGCAGWREGRFAETHMQARGPAAVVFVEGRGVVTSSTLKLRCGPDVPEQKSRCTGASSVPFDGSLEAEAAAGWRFDHWELGRVPADRTPAIAFGALDPAAGNAYAYTAIFVPTPRANLASK